MSDITVNSGLERFAAVVAESGGLSAFGRKLGVSHEAVRRWLSGDNRVTGERAIEIEQASGGAIRRGELRPDLFGADPPASAQAGEQDQAAA